MAICSGPPCPRSKTSARAGSTAQPARSSQVTGPALRTTTPAPRSAFFDVCPRPGRSHGAAARAETPRVPRSPLLPHVAGAGAAEEFWLQDLFAAVSMDLDPSIQTREDARLPGRPPRPRLNPAGARSARGLARSWGSGGGVGGEGSEVRIERLSAS